MISGARYQRVATYSVMKPAVLSDKPLANPKSQIYIHGDINLNKPFNINKPSIHNQHSQVDYPALNHDVERLQNGCTLIHDILGR